MNSGDTLDVFDDPGPRDKCGVFGVRAPGEEISKLTYFGLFALQHRGQESAGIAVSNGERITVVKDMGLVSQVFNEAALASLCGDIAVGHCRYSTNGASGWNDAQPTFQGLRNGHALALAHNGNLTNTDELETWLGALNQTSQVPRKVRMDSTSDTALVAALLSETSENGLEAAARQVLPKLVGAFCLVFCDETTLFAARDPQGLHPLVLGRLSSGWVIASESSALDIIGATFIREVEPGELIIVDDDGLRSERFAPADPHGCVFEHVYLARPDSLVSGRRIHLVRQEIGRTLAMETAVDADLVIPTPESGTPSAIGYAEASGIPYGQGLVKNSYVGRTFIQPSQTLRQLGIRLKLNPIRDVIEGKRLIVVDDSIVRGNTQNALVKMLREAGAAEVHVRIASPPVLWPCFFGIDFATRAELIAPGLSVDEICRSIGADTLAYISLEGLVASVGIPQRKLCCACFDGNYPVRIPAKRAIQLSQEGANGCG
ncbi:MAG: amidophosphoribosyltransferase [Propionibacteriaceae bacterium]|nr:amidophosphoribosyltransferase [Propionibacteriaceae bacterium]